MSWEPESFSAPQRQAAAKAVVQAQLLVDRIDRSAHGAVDGDIIDRVCQRMDEMLTMLYEDIYGFDRSRPQPPNAS